MRIAREQAASVLVKRPPKFPELSDIGFAVRPKELGALKLTARELKMEKNKQTRPASISFA